MDKGCATGSKYTFSTRHEGDSVAVTAGYVDKSGENKRNAKARRGRTSRYDKRLLLLTSEGGTPPSRLSVNAWTSTSVRFSKRLTVTFRRAPHAVSNDRPELG